MASSANNSASRAYFIPTLIASNYATWHIKIEMLLTRSELWNVVYGTEAAPNISNIASNRYFAISR